MVPEKGSGVGAVVRQDEHREVCSKHGESKHGEQDAGPFFSR